MSLYDIDFNQQINELLSPDKRTLEYTAIGKAIFSSLQYCRDLVFGTFKDKVDREILYNASRLTFEYALNFNFNTQFRQPADGTSDIFIITNILPVGHFLVGASSDFSSSVGIDTSTEFVGANYNFVISPNYTIHFPAAAYANLGSQAENIIRNFADKYSVTGTFYNIVTY